jgi:DivIVA domain-containing protein
MPFAPHEIENKRFVVALRGYQTDEVDAFLRAVAADYRAALEAGQNDPQAASGADFAADFERVLGSTREAADEEAARIRAAAERDAAELRASVEREAEAFYEEIARQASELQQIERRVRDQLHALERAVIEGKHSLANLTPVYPPPPADS